MALSNQSTSKGASHPIQTIQVYPKDPSRLPRPCGRLTWLVPGGFRSGELDVRRREFIMLFGGAVTGWPAAHAQQAAMPVIGFLNSTSPDGFTERLRKFSQGLKEQGFVEGENVAI